MGRILCGGILAYLWFLADALPYNLDEVHGYNAYVRSSLSWSLTNYPEPGHHVAHNLVLRLLYPLLEGTRVSLRWPTAIWAALTCWLAFRWGRQSLYSDQATRVAEWSRLPLILVPTCFSFFIFYGTQSRGYMLGALCFLGFLIFAQRLHRPQWRGVDPLAGVSMGLLGALSIASVLSNGTFVVGACVGFGLVDLFRRRWRVLAARLVFMLLGAAFLISWHPALRDIDALGTFNTAFGHPLNAETLVVPLVEQFAANLLSPFPVVLGGLCVLGFLVMVRQRNWLWVPIATVIGAMALTTYGLQNALMPRTWVTVVVVFILLIQAALEGLLSLCERVAKPALVRGAGGLMAVLLLGGAAAQYYDLCEKNVGWVHGLDNREWRGQSAADSLDLLPWDLYQAYYFEYPEVETKIERIYESGELARVQLAGFSGLSPSFTMGAGSPLESIATQRTAAPLGTTGRLRWTLPVLSALGPWQVAVPNRGALSCKNCVVVLLTRGKTWFHPEFEGGGVSALYFDRPVPETDIDAPRVFGHVLLEPALLSETVGRLQKDSAYIGPVRAFVVAY